jgi:SAM-dependent methyltransferase
VKCPECSEGEIIERRSKKGKTFYGCNRYPDCKFVAWGKPVAGEVPRVRQPLHGGEVAQGRRHVAVSQPRVQAQGADAARANARAEGVADRIRIEDADARKLPYANESFDVVLSSLTVHNIEEHEERTQAIAEMVRVLKPGGRLALFDIRHTGEYARQLEQLGMNEVSLSPYSFLWCQPARSLTARKA